MLVLAAVLFIVMFTQRESFYGFDNPYYTEAPYIHHETQYPFDYPYNVQYYNPHWYSNAYAGSYDYNKRFDTKCVGETC